MATSSGLYRFDGIQFELYQPPSGQRFRSDFIRTLKATPDGGLWIGFNYGGADFLKDGRLTSYGVPEGMPRGSVDEFSLDSDGVVWVATMNGLGRFDGSDWISIGRDWGYSGVATAALFMDREGTLWVASQDSLFFLLRGKHAFQKCAEHLGRTISIGQGPDGTLWLSADQRGDSNQDWTVSTIRPTTMLPLAGGQQLPRIVEIDAVGGSFIDHAGSLWIAGDVGLLRVPYPEHLDKNKSFRLDEHIAQRFQQKDGLTSDDLGEGDIFEDAQGEIWVGTAAGLDRFRESNVVPVPVATNKPAPLLVAGGYGDVWTYAWTFSQSSLVDLRGLTASSQVTQADPTAGYRDDHGVIWLGGPKGLWKLENGDLTRYPLPESVDPTARLVDVQAITGDAAGGLWISLAGNGAYHWANGVWSEGGNRQELRSDIPVSLLADSAGRIWFGYMGSKIALLDHDHVTTFSSADGLQVVNTQAIYEREGRVWVGGERGLALFRNNRFQSVTPEGEAKFNGVSGIVETANGDLWVNATPGIFHIAAGEMGRAIKDPTYPVRYELFGLLDGLTGKATQLRPIPSEVESSDGLLWFSTNAGIYQINPRHLLRNAVAPSVSIRSLDAGGVTYTALGAVRLPARTTDIHITYTAPNLSVPERVRYRYELEGPANNWQDAGTRREAFYTNLGPGHYRFRVMACNEDGVWNNVGAMVDFTIAPAWFQTYWFFALCGAVAFFIVWAFYRMRVEQVSKAMAARFDERLSERTRIARDFHDTLLQTIQGTKLVADSALRRPTDPIGALEQVSMWMGRATDEGRAALNSLRTSTTEGNDLAAAFRRAIEECRGQSSVEASFSVVGEASEMHPIVRDEIYRIGYEAIRNASVHSRGTQLQVELTYADDLILCVGDNGVGIDTGVVDEGKDGHFGLQGMRERAGRIAAKLTVETSKEFGTEVRLVVPGNIIYRRVILGRGKGLGIKAVLRRMGLATHSTED